MEAYAIGGRDNLNNKTTYHSPGPNLNKLGMLLEYIMMLKFLLLLGPIK